MANAATPDPGEITSLLTEDPQLEDLSRRLLTFHLRPIMEDDGDLPRLALALALPRSFDAEIVAVMRGHADPPRDKALLDRLRDFSLVLERQDGSLAYHDTLRHTLLVEWYRDAPDEAMEINRRLIAYHEQHLAWADVLQRDLKEVGELIAEASPARCAALIAAVRAQTLGALREAQYHSIAVSSETGCGFFGRQCERLEAAGRLSLCSELARMARDDLEHLPIAVDAAAFLRHIEYWEARIDLGRDRFGAARERLEALERESEGQDDKLRLWTLLALASAHRGEGNRQGTREALKKAVALINDSDPDPHNAALAYAQSADLEELWLDLRAARASYLTAAEKAREVGNVSTEIGACLGLAGISAREGDRPAAIGEALRALDLVRSAAIRDGLLYADVLGALMRLIGRESPRHLPTMQAELVALRREAGDDEDSRQAPRDDGLALAYADAARRAGLLTLAGEILDGIAKDPDALASSFRCYVAGDVRREQGQLAAARALFGTLIDDPGSSRFDRAAGRTNKGLVELEIDPHAADENLAAAAELWSEMDHANNAALARAFRARALALLGRVEEGAHELTQAESAIEDPPPEVEASLQKSRAFIARARADWDAAVDAEIAAADADERIGATRDHVLALWRAAGTLGHAARWDQAAEMAGRAAAGWQEIARRDATLLSRPEEMEAGDGDDAAGVHALFRGHGADHLHRARAAFRSAADKVSNDPWYNLQLAYTCAAIGDWTEAQYALDRVIEQGAPWDDEVFVSRRDQFTAQRELAGQEPGEDVPRFGFSRLRKALGID